MTDNLKQLPPPKLDELEEILDNDKNLVLFFLAWLKNGQNATKAYRELHPNVTYESAMVMGSNSLRKIKIPVIMETYGLDLNEYFKKLKEGLEATKVVSARIILKKGSNELSNQEANSRTDDFIEVPDYAVRKQYHDKVGKLLGIEKDKEGLGILIKDEEKNIQIEIIEFKEKSE